MSEKSYANWLGLKFWCQQNPGKSAALVTPSGTFTITFVPVSPRERLKDVKYFGEMESRGIPQGERQ